MNGPASLLALASASFLFFAAPATAQDAYWDDYSYEYDGGQPAPSARSHRGKGLFGASNFSYGYFDAGFSFHDFDNEAVDNATGFGGAISIPIVDSFYLKGGLDFASPDLKEGGDLDYFAWKVGAGFGFPIGGLFDLVLEAGVGHQKLEGDNFDDEIDGTSFYVTPWLRAGGDIIEVNAGVTFSNVDSDSNVAVDLRGLLHLTPSVSLFGEAVLAEELNRYGAGLRIEF